MIFHQKKKKSKKLGENLREITWRARGLRSRCFKFLNFRFLCKIKHIWLKIHKQYNRFNRQDQPTNEYKSSINDKHEKKFLKKKSREITCLGPRPFDRIRKEFRTLLNAYTLSQTMNTRTHYNIKNIWIKNLLTEDEDKLGRRESMLNLDGGLCFLRFFDERSSGGSISAFVRIWSDSDVMLWATRFIK